MTVGLHPLQFGYVALLVGTAAVLLGLIYWIYDETWTARGRAILPVLVASTAWALVAALELLVAHRLLGLVLLYGRTFASMVTVIAFLYFATVYTGRSTSLRRPRNAAFVLAFVLSTVALVTDPSLGLFYETVTHHAAPFPYYGVEIGTVASATFAWVYAAGIVSLGYLAVLFLKSRHRPSTALAVLVVGQVIGTVPSMLTGLGLVQPLPGYDYTVMGLTVATISYVVVARMGMLEIAPISRDRLLGTTEDALVTVDDERRVADYNDAGATVITAADDDPLGRPLATVAPDVAESVTFPDGETTHTTTLTIPVDGVERHYSATVSAIRDRGEVRGYTILLRDLTETYRYREELERQNDQLEDFASTVSHDLRNPLQIASGHATIVEDALESLDADPERRETLREYAGSLDASLERMEAIIADLRTLAKHGQSVDETADVDFRTAVEATWREVETEAATLAIETTGTIQAERSRFRTILENLLRNAVEHGSTSPRSQVREDAVEHGSTSPRSQAHEDAVEHGSTSPRSQVREDSVERRSTSSRGGERPASVEIEVGLTDDGFYVQDDGPGVPESDLDRVFEYGFTTSQDGTGLGLNIVRTMVEAHGWSVAVDPEYDDGTRIFVTDAKTTRRDPEPARADRELRPAR